MEDGSLFSYVYAAKFFSATYKDREIFREMFPLTFKIAFRASGKTFSDFRILSVDIAAKNFFEQDQGAEIQKLPELKIQPVSRKGFSFIVYGPYGLSQIQNMNFENLKMDVNNFKWGTDPSFGFSGGIGFYYFQNDHLALRSGIEMNNFQSVYTLKGSFLDTK